MKVDDCKMLKQISWLSTFWRHWCASALFEVSQVRYDAGRPLTVTCGLFQQLSGRPEATLNYNNSWAHVQLL